MSGSRVSSSPDLLPMSTSNHEDLSLEGIATNVKLLLKLIQDHQEASHKGIIDERKTQRFAGMMTILDDVKTRLQKSQASGKKTRAELRRCNTDLRFNPPRDSPKKEELDEKEKLRRDLNTSFAAQKRLGVMCASLGREKEIIARELTRKVQEMNEMEQLVNDLRTQNEKLSSKIQASVAEDKRNGKGRVNQMNCAAVQERNKELSDQLLKSIEGYKLMKRKFKEAQEDRTTMQALMEELGGEIEVGFRHIHKLKQCIVSEDCGEGFANIEKNIEALERIFKTFELKVSKHRREGRQ